MALFEWNDRFSVKIKSIDDQHKVIVKYINDLHDGMSKGKGSDVLKPILEGLVAYTANHFKYEEKLFGDFNYPDKAAHEKEHADLVAKVIEFRDKVSSGQATVSTEIMQFLKEWLMKHILGTDMKYSKFLNEKGVN